MLATPYGDVYEFLAAFVESMQLDPPWGEKARVDALSKLRQYYEALTRGEHVGRETILLLYRLGLIKPCTNSRVTLNGIRVCPAVPLERLEYALRSHILVWHPTRLLLRFLALNGGSATITEVAASLGCTVKRLTASLYDALLPLVPDPRVLRVNNEKHRKSVAELCGYADEKGVLKPFNRRRVKNLLVPLLTSLRLIEFNGERLSLTEEGWDEAQRALTPPNEETVVTLPLLPQLYAAMLAVFYKPSKRLYIITPWIETHDVDLLKALISIASSHEVIILMREERKNRNMVEPLKSICKNANIECAIGLVSNLHAKIYLGSAALISSANLLTTSLGRNYEIGVYYRVAEYTLRNIVEEVSNIAIYI